MFNASYVIIIHVHVFKRIVSASINVINLIIVFVRSLKLFIRLFIASINELNEFIKWLLAFI